MYKRETFNSKSVLSKFANCGFSQFRVLSGLCHLCNYFLLTLRQSSASDVTHHTVSHLHVGLSLDLSAIVHMIKC